ncbi:hypothetical protein [Roseateles koreensis]|uniref:Uncharacterized protein n=1 Tax=Roseateles koreensis TaxID=2987526 RepID=A0ABT5KVP5_9BURK|nr:hypothetical protein [Roseateles koreensis]MDC8785901.1 hypothetical protein [Roseateles koreensis]
MTPFQLFILRLRRTRIVVGFCSALVCSVAIGKPRLEQLEPDSPLRSIPGDAVKAFRDSKYLWIEYCPDNTCDVIRTSAKVDIDAFASLASAYYFYFSRYEYLKQWQSDVGLGHKIDKKLISLARQEECSGLAGKDLARCRLTGLERQSGLQILFIRYDEQSRSKLRIPTKEALQ